MLEAALWGLVAGSSLIIGALIAMFLRPAVRIVGLTLAFGAGTLIAAVAYELVGTSIHEGDAGTIFVGMIAGSLTFLLGDWLISARGAHARKAMEPEAAVEGGEPEESGVAIVLGTVLDGVPESFVMGLALSQDAGSAAGLIAAVFVSNLPEAIGATSSLSRNGWEQSRILVMWSAIALVTALSSALGYAFFDAAEGRTGEIIEAFAAGAIIAMLATTMMPEAYRSGGRLVGVVTTLGFAAGFGMTAAW